MSLMSPSGTHVPLFLQLTSHSPPLRGEVPAVPGQCRLSLNSVQNHCHNALGSGTQLPARSRAQTQTGVRLR